MICKREQYVHNQTQPNPKHSPNPENTENK